VSPAPDTPSDERVVFHTVAGDLVFVLYPQAAPKTALQFLKLVRAGVYDTTAISRVHPGFIAQVSTAQDRQQPLSKLQSGLLQRIPLEASGLKHVRGVLSLAHPDGDPDGGESSFCILLGNAPQLDGKYTLFGRLESGDEVLTRLLEVPRDAQFVPGIRLTISRAEVFNSVEELRRAALAPAHAVAGAPLPSSAGARDGIIAGAVSIMMLTGLACALLRQRLQPAIVASLNLISVLVGMFILLFVLLPGAQARPWLGALLFFGLIGVFRALGKFEAAVELPRSDARERSGNAAS